VDPVGDSWYAKPGKGALEVEDGRFTRRGQVVNRADKLIGAAVIVAALSGCRGCGGPAQNSPGSAHAPSAASAPAAAASGELIIWGDADPDTGDAPLAVEFTADPLEDIDQPVYTWDFGDGSPPSNEQNPGHTYKTPGHYSAQVKVTDVAGRTGDDTVDIDVEGATPSIPPG
jgi:hypothetical protein